MCRGIDVLPATDHRLDQIVLLDVRVERDGGEVQRDEGHEQVDGDAMHPRQEIARVLANEIEERAAKGDVVVGEQAGADLKDLRDINEQAAQIVAPAAKALAPQRSGRLAKSIRAGATQKAGVVRAGNNGKDETEGARYKNVIGTYMHGSILPKNPKLADWLIERAVTRKYGDFSATVIEDRFAEKARDIAARRPR